MSERLAFDVARYRQSGELNLGALAEDLAGWTKEAGTGSDEDRVNPFLLQVTKDGRVINPSLGDRDVALGYADETELEKKETKVGLEMRECLLSQPLGTVAVWISPPGGGLKYDEGRMVVGVNSRKDGLRVMESYGISNNFSAEDCLDVAKDLNSICNQDYELLHPEDVRDKVFIVNEYQGGVWEFLKKVIPLEKVWESIEKGEASIAKREALEDAWAAARRIENTLGQAETRLDYLKAGALLEDFMAERGRKVVGGSCGMTNNEAMDFRLFSHLEINADGEVSDGGGESGKFVHSCPQCGKSIKKVIQAGYQCKCGGVYKGC